MFPINWKQEFSESIMVSSISHGSTALISEREKLEFESLPEFVREPRSASKDSYVSKAAYVEDEEVLPKSAELEALWPGVNADFLHSTKKGPSFYLTLGFLGGAVVSLVGVWTFAFVSHMAVAPPQAKQIVVAHGKQGVCPTVAGGSATESATAPGGAVVTTRVSAAGDAEVIVPLASVYEVKSGDTLAGIAIANYKRATPRLLDAICKANGMRSANVLSLGQKLNLPDYRPQRQIATGAGSVQQ